MKIVNVKIKEYEGDLNADGKILKWTLKV